MAQPKDPVPVDRLKHLLRYDKATGLLHWKVCRGSKIKPGDPAGSRTTNGYVEVMIDGQHCKAHRVAWAMTYGEWPDWPVDHIDGDPSNNSIKNLRLMTDAGNSQNVHKPRTRNKTGFLGVWQVVKNGRFAAEIFANGKKHHIGYFGTAEEAHEAYKQAKRKLHPDVYAV